MSLFLSLSLLYILTCLCLSVCLCLSLSLSLSPPPALNACLSHPLSVESLFLHHPFFLSLELFVFVLSPPTPRPSVSFSLTLLSHSLCGVSLFSTTPFSCCLWRFLCVQALVSVGYFGRCFTPLYLLYIQHSRFVGAVDQ